MADSPGKVLSSFASSNETKGNHSRLGGCACVILQLLDRFHGKKLLPHNLLPSERPKHDTISHREEKLPMAKLLLIADEKRIAASKEDKETLSVSDGFCQRNEDHEEGNRRASVSVVARLMGLETMPSPKLLVAERKQAEESSEAQSTIKLLQCKKVPVKRAQRNTKAMDIRIQTLKRTTKSSLTDLSQRLTGSNSVADTLKHPSVRSKLNVKSRSCESLTQMNSRKGEDPMAFIFSKPPLPTIQMESQLRSILSPSRASSKLLSPNKSPLSSKSAARLFEAAARVLEPNFRPARHLRFSSHNDKSAPNDSADEENKKQSSTLSESKGFPPSNVPSAESKGQATSRCSNSSLEKSKRLSPNCAIQNRPVHSKHGARKTVLHVKNENKMLTRKKPSLLSKTSKLEAKDPTDGECRLITSSTGSNCAPINNERENVPAPVMEEGSKQEGSSAMQGLLSLSPPGTRSAKRFNHGKTSKPSRTERAPQRLFSTSHTPGKNMIQEGSRNNVKARFVTDSKATSLSKPTSTNAHGRTNLEDLKRQSSCSRSSSKRKASSLSPKPNILSNVTRTDVGNFKLQNVEHKRNLWKLANERQSNSPQSEFNAPAAVCCSDDCDAGSSIEAESRGQTRVRARWDIADERKKTLTTSYISCSNSNGQLSSCSSVISSTLKEKDALETDEVAAGSLQGPLLSLDASTSRSLSPELGTPEYKPLCFSNGSESLYDCNSRCVKGLTGLLNECSSNIDCYLGGAKQQLRNDDRISVQEDSSAQDSESISGSFCAEECEQPSPISILESPFHDSASCSSDTYEAPQGIKLWEAMVNKVVDDVSTIADHMEDANGHGIQIDKKSFTHASLFHCSDFGSSENSAIREDEDSYVKKILGTLFPSAESAVWERLAFSGPLIDPLLCFQLEENHLLTHRARMTTGPCSKEFEQERQVPTTYTTTWFKEAAPQQKKLLFDCIEAALKLSLELAIWSYGFLVPCMQFPPAYLEEAVHRHLGEWKGLAFSMNLDDMMKVEINAGMERWFKYGDEVESVAMNVEAMIFDGLVDELTKDVLQKARAYLGCFQKLEGGP